MDDKADRKALFEASGLKGGRVLDIGMGDCACMSFFMASRGFQVLGVDRSPRAVHDARVNAVKKRLSGSFTARLANAERLPFSPDEFDAVIAYDSLHHADNIRKIIKEMFRVCKSKGLVVISEIREDGQDYCECASGAGKVLRKIEKYLAEHSTAIRKLRAKHNMIFVCKKPAKQPNGPARAKL